MSIEMEQSKIFTVSLIGRPNVGKSTLFNRLSKRKASIVHAQPAVTRDRIYRTITFEDSEFRLVDTGGLAGGKQTTELSEGILQQTLSAVEEADLVVFLTDAAVGIQAADDEIAIRLKKSKKPVILAVNKCDSEKLLASASEFYQLGFNSTNFISSAQGVGIEELLSEVTSRLPKSAKKEDLEGAADAAIEELPVAIIGKPNAGKSSFLNKILGENRHLISETAGTTVDAVDSELNYAGVKFRLIDTAGIRKKRSIFEDLEKMAVSTSLGAIDRAQVAVLLLDVTGGITEQDMKVAAFAENKAKGLVLVVNKWDLSQQNGIKQKEFEQLLRDKMPFVAYAPVLFASALTGRRVFDVLEKVVKVGKNYNTRVPTGEFNRMIKTALESHQLPIHRGRRVKIYYGSQVSVAPPTFKFTCNDPKGVHFSYKRYLVNQIRQAFGFEGSPVRLVFKARSQGEANAKKRK